VESFKAIGDQLKQAGIPIDEAELRFLPNNASELEVEETMQVVRVIEALEDLDDVQDVYSTLTISDEAMAQLEAA
jgi:transcriptional/translational regulatory protein YebC/TACO1